MSLKALFAAVLAASPVASDPQAPASKPSIPIGQRTPLAATQRDPKATPSADPKPVTNPGPMFTTYFYTAGEAVIHGYSPDTTVRIISLDRQGTIFEGKIGEGEAKIIPTGAGVFGFLSDKKAAILVGTPSSCAVVGYFLKDEEGAYRSSRFFTQLPSQTYARGEKFTVWAYEPSHAQIIDRKTGHVLKEGDLQAGGYLELSAETLQPLSNQVLEVRATKGKVSAEVYYDEGFIVPSDTGRGAGRLFYTYAGDITNGTNDLDLMAQVGTTEVTVTDLDTKKEVWKGTVEKGQMHVVGLLRQHVKVESALPISVAVAGYDHFGAGYAEQHFGSGIEGSGIENDFLITTSGELWLFSYYKDNEVEVTDAKTGKQVFQGTLASGGFKSFSPGLGLFRVKSHKGVSVRGGAGSCGADYSPAAGMFAVDEAMLAVLAQVKEERAKAAAASGTVLTPAAAAAPMTASEWQKYGAPAKAKSYSGMSLDEANERAAAVAK
jgi:hypothetical protein